MDNSERNNVVYGLVQRDGHMLHNCKVSRILPRVVETAKHDRRSILHASYREYGLLILQYWADAPKIHQPTDLYEDLIKCCVGDAISKDMLFLLANDLLLILLPPFSSIKKILYLQIINDEDGGLLNKRGLKFVRNKPLDNALGMSTCKGLLHKAMKVNGELFPKLLETVNKGGSDEEPCVSMVEEEERKRYKKDKICKVVVTKLRLDKDRKDLLERKAKGKADGNKGKGKFSVYDVAAEEMFYPHLLTTIFGRRWLLTHGLELAISKCLNSTEYLSTLGAAICKAIEKGMQDGLSTGITHGAKGRVLTDVAAYNPFVKADYLAALQRLQSVNFSLNAELKSNKDASIDT
nr:hypothetical protein [Tanacetum cinerariifolium]